MSMLPGSRLKDPVEQPNPTQVDLGYVLLRLELSLGSNITGLKMHNM